MSEHNTKDRKEAFVKLDKVSKIYGSKEVKIVAVDEISFEIEKGEFVVVVGPSGAGKTTVLNILGGMDKATSGSVWVDGNDIAKYSNHKLTGYRREDIGFVFQFYNLVQNLSVEENILLPVLMDGKKTANYKEQLDELLEIIQMQDLRKRTPRELSGGQQQRVAIARSLINDPSIIFADEPIGNLDSQTGIQIMELFQNINQKKNKTIVQVTHSMESINYGNRIISMKDGIIIR